MSRAELIREAYKLRINDPQRLSTVKLKKAIDYRKGNR